MKDVVLILGRCSRVGIIGGRRRSIKYWLFGVGVLRCPLCARYLCPGSGTNPGVGLDTIIYFFSFSLKKDLSKIHKNILRDTKF